MSHRSLVTLVFTASSLLLASPSPASADTPSVNWGFDMTGMDRTVAPGDDFFTYANGAWQRRTQIPEDRSMVGLFNDLRIGADSRVRDILGDSTGKIRTLYDAFLDEKTVEARGRAPLDADLDRIRTAGTREDIASLMGQAHAGFGASIFDLDFEADPSDRGHYAVTLGQAGLGLPDRDYYLQPKFARQLAGYGVYIARLLEMAGWPDAESRSRDLVAFETRIAEASWTHQEVRDPVKTDNPRTIADLEREAPGFAWKHFIEAAGLVNAPRLIATTDTSLPRIAAIFAETPLETLKAWLAFRTADGAAPYLPDVFVQAHHEFRLRSLAGQTAPLARWQRGVRLVDEAMGSAVGELYVQRYYTPDSEVAMGVLIGNLRGALRTSIEKAAWMSSATRREALRKLAGLEVQVGRPRNWIDYTALSVRSDDLYGDVGAARGFDWKRRVAQLSAPWNKSDWRFWPQYATAYTENGQLIFTAAMLQPPFFDPKADTAVNYGAIGAVIGHELTHHFDDQGRLEDADGKLRNWWTPADARRFEIQAQRLSAQYSAMTPLPGLHLKGDLTLGENIADLGGVSIALAAYHTSLGGRPAPLIDGFTGDQRFFLSWAQGWREIYRDDKLRQMIASDVHSPSTARVNGVMRNIDDWYGAWSVRPGQSLFLNPGERVRIW